MENMSLWAIDNAIDEILSTMVNEDGEIDESAIGSLEDLEMAKAEKVENIACYIKNLNTLVANIKAEKKVLAERQASVEKKVDRLKKYLQDSLAGEKMQSAKYAISYRTSTKCVVDPDRCMTWLYDNGYEDCIKVETSVRVDEVKQLLKDGVDVVGAELQQSVSMTIK